MARIRRTGKEAEDIPSRSDLDRIRKCRESLDNSANEDPENPPLTEEEIDQFRPCKDNDDE